MLFNISYSSKILVIIVQNFKFFKFFCFKISQIQILTGFLQILGFSRIPGFWASLNQDHITFQIRTTQIPTLLFLKKLFKKPYLKKYVILEKNKRYICRSIYMISKIYNIYRSFLCKTFKKI